MRSGAPLPGVAAKGRDGRRRRRRPFASAIELLCMCVCVCMDATPDPLDPSRCKFAL